MTDPEPLVRYGRGGGRPPRDAERLEIAADGTFQARRTVAGHRVGEFRGRLDADELAALTAEARAAGAASDLDIGRPFDAAVEMTETNGRTATMGSNEQPTGPWAPLILRLRRLADALVDAGEAVAGIELRVGAGDARLAQVGTDPLDIDRESIVIRATRLDEQGLVVARWQGSVAPPQIEDAIGSTTEPDWVTAGPGWEMELPFRHGIELAPGDWLQVIVVATIRTADGARAVRLSAAVPAATG